MCIPASVLLVVSWPDARYVGRGAGARLLVRLEITPIDNTMVQAFSSLGRFRMAVKNEDDRQDKGTEGKL